MWRLGEEGTAMRTSRIVAVLVCTLALVLGLPGAVPATAAAGAPAAVQGQVLSCMDPIGYARVTVFSADTGAKLGSVMTDGSGYYMVTGLPAIPVQVRATKPGYLESWADGAHSRASATVYPLAPGETLQQSWDPMRLYLDITPEGVVTGTVVRLANPSSPNARPVAGARVVVTSATTGERLGSAVTTRRGTFRVGMLPAGQVTVRVKAAGLAAVYAPNSPPGEVVRFDVQAGAETDVGVVRVYSTATVYGYIVWHMDPISQPSEVTVFNARTGRTIRTVTVPPDGSFELDGLQPGRIRVRVRAEGFLDSWWGPVTLRAGQVLGPNWSDGAAVFELVPEGVLTGRVMGFNNDPLAGWDDPLGGVHVSVVSTATGTVLGRAVTDAGGEFRIGRLPAGPVQVRAAVPAWDTTSWAPDQPTRLTGEVYQVASEETVDVGTIRVFAAATITGTVRSATRPVARAKVTVFDAVTRKAIASTRTRADGRYTLTGLWTGESRQVKVRASRAGYRTAWADSAPGSSWATATVFTLSPGTTLAQSADPPVLTLTLTRR